MSKLDEYGRAIIFGRSDESHFGISTTGRKGTLVIENVDYVRMKLFQLSILFRAGVSQRAFFSKVRLGPHEEKIRKMLTDEIPGAPEAYGCVPVAFLRKSGKLLTEMIPKPQSKKIDGHRTYSFLFAGCGWIFVVSSHANTFKHKERFLQQDCKLVIPWSLQKSPDSRFSLTGNGRKNGAPMKKTLYVDMDNVLVDFQSGTARILTASDNSACNHLF